MRALFGCLELLSKQRTVHSLSPKQCLACPPTQLIAGLWLPLEAACLGEGKGTDRRKRLARNKNVPQGSPKGLSQPADRQTQTGRRERVKLAGAADRNAGLTQAWGPGIRLVSER